MVLGLNGGGVAFVALPFFALNIKIANWKIRTYIVSDKITGGYGINTFSDMDFVYAATK